MDRRWILALFIAAVVLLVLLMVLFWPSADPDPRPEDLGGIESPAAFVAMRDRNTVGKGSELAPPPSTLWQLGTVLPIDVKARNT